MPLSNCVNLLGRGPKGPAGGGTPIGGSLAVTQIAYGSAANTIKGQAGFTFAEGTGALSATQLLTGGVANGTGAIQFPATTTSAGGITLGDVNLFRLQAGYLFLNAASGTQSALSLAVGGTEKMNYYVDSSTGIFGTVVNLPLVIRTNNTAAITISATQDATFAGAIIGGIQALSGAGAVNVTQLTTAFTSTGGAQALTLANGSNGQIKTITHVVDGGSGVLTPTTKTGYTTITFTNAGDAVTLQYFTTQGWLIVGIFGAIAA